MKLDLLFNFFNKFLYTKNNLTFSVWTFTLNVAQLHLVITTT